MLSANLAALAVLTEPLPPACVGLHFFGWVVLAAVILAQAGRHSATIPEEEDIPWA